MIIHTHKCQLEQLGLLTSKHFRHRSLSSPRSILSIEPRNSIFRVNLDSMYFIITDTSTAKISGAILEKQKKSTSDAGNRTPSCCVRDSDVSHYTTSDVVEEILILWLNK